MIKQCLFKKSYTLPFRLTNWQIIKNVGITFLGFQDVIKDVFLLTKLILSIGVASFLSDPSTHSFATIVSFCNYVIILCLTWSNWRRHVASRSSGDWCYGWPPIYGFQLNINKGPFIYYVITFLGFWTPLRNHVFSTENNQKLTFSDPPPPLQVIT